MSNLISTEKALKHWLKNKVAVTTATVVGFLIMGTVSFGVDITEDRTETIKGNNITIAKDKNVNINLQNGTTGIDYDFINQLENNIIENNGNIIAETFNGNAVGIYINSKPSIGSDDINNWKELNNLTITNNGTIKTTVKNGGSATPIYADVRVKDGNALKITNNGQLIAERIGASEGRGALSAVYINSKGKGKVEFTNSGSGIIEVKQGVGIEVSGNAEVTNTGTIKLSNSSIAVKNNGATVHINGTIEVTDKNGNDVAQESLFVGVNKENIKGMIKGKDGVAIKNSNSTYLDGTFTITEINKKGEKTKSVTLGLKNTTTINGKDKEAINLDALNIVGDVNILDVKVNNTTINIDDVGKLKVGKIEEKWDNGKKEVLTPSTLELNGSSVNQKIDKTAVELIAGSTLSLKDVNFNGGISSDEKENKLNVFGNTYINGNIGVKNITVGTDGKAVSSDKLTLSSNSSFTKATTLTNTTGVTIFQIGKDLENALVNSDPNAIVTIKGKIDFDLSSITKDEDIDLFGGTDHNLTEAKYENVTDQVYNTVLNRETGTLFIRYNKSLFADARLNAVNNEAQMINGNFSQVTSEREGQMDKIYSGSIYAETIRAAYDNLKLNEGTILSLSNNVKAGEFTAEGRAIYNKDEYKRDGVVGKYDVENETSGLLASLEYGVNDTTKTGLVFAGSKQDLDVTGGKADGDLFYLGFYGVKSLGNYDLTAGLGYQLGKYDATNTAANVVGKDKYDTKALSGYVQAKYLGDLGDGLSIQPKVKLGYTHLKQDSAKDSYFGLTDTDVTTFDTELGADLVKTVQLEKSKVDVKFGTAFVKTFGDTDKEFKGQFFGANTASNQFGVHGGELSENVLKFNLGAEVANENGFFYNGGFTYEFGSEDMKSYGVNVGAGYRF